MADIVDLDVVDKMMTTTLGCTSPMTMNRTPPTLRTDSPSSFETVVESRFDDLQAQLELLKTQVRQAQQLSSLGTAAATFAHEVSNLLTPILNYARSALNSDDQKLRSKALTITLQNVEMLIAMSDRMLEINAASPAKREAVSVRDAAEAARDSLCRDLAKDGISFSIDQADSVEVWVDPLQIRQVFFNLFLNAWEAMEPQRKGRLTVSASPEGETVIVSVHNTGPPISPDLLPNLFDPFQSSKITSQRKRKRCSGLGLALCRDLIEENGGTISVTSDAQSGTVFTLKLPAAKSSVND